MIQLRRGRGRYRGGDPEAGIETRHAFSFGGFYDPRNVRFGSLVACNEERLRPGAGFAEHAHRDMEIVTWVLDGELTHEDSAGRTGTLRPGDVAHLTAGTGIRHVERNAGPAPLTFLQMWLMPTAPGGPPSYEIVRGIADGTPLAVEGAASVLHLRRLRPGERTALPDAPWVYVHVARGTVRLDPGTPPAEAGDAVRIAGCEGQALTAADGGAEALVWEMRGAGRD
ncbi:pirin family protein [Streptomyces sp. MAR4 CNX-425]|uniref:pirin family protein n=1 Tax=Streptomyces sp. MAR4 CNX-425 TaxID=3406343 RepID=UPI003B5054F6